jgi:hypothetical protein
MGKSTINGHFPEQTVSLPEATPMIIQTSMIAAKATAKKPSSPLRTAFANVAGHRFSTLSKGLGENLSSRMVWGKHTSHWSEISTIHHVARHIMFHHVSSVFHLVYPLVI